MPIEAFRHRPIGTELMSLAVAQVLPDLFGDDSPSHPTEPDGKYKDWICCFGFIASPAGDNDGLPVGFPVTYYRPASCARSPIPFVRFRCAISHTTQICTDANSVGAIVAAPGSVSAAMFPDNAPHNHVHDRFARCQNADSSAR